MSGRIGLSGYIGQNSIGPSMFMDGIGVGSAPNGVYPLMGALGLGRAPVIEVFCRSTGSDTTGDGTLANPYLTPQRATQDAPAFSMAREFRINMTGYGLFTSTENFTFPPMVGAQIRQYIQGGTTVEGAAFGSYYQTDLTIYAEPTLTLSIPIASCTLSQVAGAAQHCLVQVAGASWTVDQWKNFGLVVITSPTTSSCVRIVSNTADTLLLTERYSVMASATPAGAVLNIMTESCSISMPGTARFSVGSGLGPGGNYSTATYGINFIGNAGTSFNDVVVSSTSRYAVMCKNYGFIESQCGAMTMLACSIGADVDASSVNGMSLSNCTGGATTQISNKAGGLFVTSCYGIGGPAIGEGIPQSYPSAHYGRFVTCFYSTNRDTANAGFGLVGPRAYGVVGYCDFTNCAQGALKADGGAQIIIDGPISGTGNGTSTVGAFNVRGFAQILLKGKDDINGTELDITQITCRGAYGDISVGLNPLISLETFFATGRTDDLRRTGALMVRGQDSAVPVKPACDVLVANGTLAVGTLGKMSSVAGRIDVLKNVTGSDTYAQARCVIQSAATAGAAFLAQTHRGVECSFLLDAAGNVAAGAPIYLSTTADGAASSAGTVIITYANTAGTAGGLVKGYW